MSHTIWQKKSILDNCFERVEMKELQMACQNEPNLASKKQLFFMCETCDSKFDSKLSLDQHIASHKKINIQMWNMWSQLLNKG